MRRVASDRNTAHPHPHRHRRKSSAALPLPSPPPPPSFPSGRLHRASHSRHHAPGHALPPDIGSLPTPSIHVPAEYTRADKDSTPPPTDAPSAAPPTDSPTDTLPRPPLPAPSGYLAEVDERDLSPGPPRTLSGHGSGPLSVGMSTPLTAAQGPPEGARGRTRLSRGQGSLSNLAAAAVAPSDPDSDSEAASGAGPVFLPPKLPPKTVSLKELALRIWPCALSLALNAMSSFVVFPFFTYVPSSGWLGPKLPKLLFMVKITIDNVGRALPNAHGKLMLRSGRLLLAISVFKASLEAFFFAYLFAWPRDRLSDGLLCAFVVVYWLLAGFISTTAYCQATRKAERKAPEGSVPVRGNRGIERLRERKKALARDIGKEVEILPK